MDWAADGKAGWEYLTTDRATYSLAIIDWMLPKVSGIELCQRLRAEKYTLPILMLTARDRMEDKITQGGLIVAREIADELPKQGSKNNLKFIFNRP